MRSTTVGSTPSASSRSIERWRSRATANASMFVWARVPDEHLRGKGTIDYAMDLMDHAEVAIAQQALQSSSSEEIRQISFNLVKKVAPEILDLSSL